MSVLKHKENGIWKVTSSLPEALTGTTDPTTATQGFPGRFYVNTATKGVFVCIAATTDTYTWAPVENPENKTTEITASSTDIEYPTAKAVYDDAYTPLNTGKEDKGYLTLNGTHYPIRTSTTDAGETGYITFVIQS